MKIEPELLETKGYVLLTRLGHSELVPFVQTYLFRKGLWPLIYLGLNILFLSALVFAVVQSFDQDPAFRLSEALGKASLGLGLAFLLIPLHEYIHAIAYRLCGAREVSYDADLKKMIFMAIAHRFVAGAGEFRFVALAPFTFISLAGLASLPFVEGNFTFTALALVFTHAAFCGGDFAMLSYLEVHKNKDVVTWDDKVNKISYFYGKPRIS